MVQYSHGNPWNRCNIIFKQEKNLCYIAENEEFLVVPMPVLSHGSAKKAHHEKSYNTNAPQMYSIVISSHSLTLIKGSTILNLNLSLQKLQPHVPIYVDTAALIRPNTSGEQTHTHPKHTTASHNVPLHTTVTKNLKTVFLDT